MVERLKNLFRKPFKSLRLQDKQKIIKAFVYQGKDYFMFDDIFSIPSIRGLQALDYYEEFNMRCTKDYLIRWTESAEKILSDNKKINLIELATLVKHLQERLKMIPVSEHIFKIASVIFFDDSENPYVFDRKYNKKKIDLWKKDPEVLSFFLQTPLKDLIPYLDSQGASLATYSGVVKELNTIHFREVLKHLSPKITTIDM
jgi:hypothetical protein